MRILVTGPKGTGKSTAGEKLAHILSVPFIETDHHIEHLYASFSKNKRTCREIFRKEGEPVFREWERRAVMDLEKHDWCVIATGGGTMFNAELRRMLSSRSIVVMLRAADELLWERIVADGVPPFLEGEDGFERNKKRNRELYGILTRICDLEIEVTRDNEDRVHEIIAEQAASIIMLKMYSPNTFGETIRTTTFGESHGIALGAVMDGIKPGITLSEEDVQKELDRRRPGQSRVTTPRNESDTVRIVSGVFEGKTTGTPVCMIVYNRDQDSSKYDALRDVFRPGHADFTFWKKYGLRDHRGGGRSSGRETIGRVAAGAVAKKLLRERGIEIVCFAKEIAGISGEKEDYALIESNAVRAADPDRAKDMEAAILDARKQNDSVGGIVKLIVKNVPPGLGDPVFYKLDARLAMAIFSIGAVKGVEFGAGFHAARLRGSKHNDAMENGSFISNNAGGILGGISTGQDIIAMVAVKPTPSIAREQKTIDTDGNNRTIVIEGRHDPCIVPRIIPVVESMAALVVLDALAIQEKLQ